MLELMLTNHHIENDFFKETYVNKKEFQFKGNPLLFLVHLFSNKTTRAIKKANLSLLVSFSFLANKGPNDGNQHCRQEITDLDSFAPDEVDPNTENEAGAD